MYKRCYLVINTIKDTSKLDEITKYIHLNHTHEYEIIKNTDSIHNMREDDLYLLCLSDDEIKKFFLNHLNNNLNIALLPNPECKKAMKNYSISTDIFKAIDDGFNEKLRSEVDILSCNETVVFTNAIIGDMHGMNHYDFGNVSIFGKIIIFWKNLSRIQFQNYKLTIAEDKVIETVAIGITVMEQSLVTNKKINETLPIHDGKLNTFILAPTSLLAYLWYLFSIFLTKKISIFSLPKSMGFIQSSQLKITSSTPIEFMIDGNLVSSKEIEFIVHQNALKLHLGRTLGEENEKSIQNNNETNDIVNVKTLPQKELGEILVSGNLPFFKRASDDEFKDLFIGLRASSKFSSVFLTLTILSTLLATTGLFGNSAPVIIGAMILAPLMAPIVSLAMGTIRADSSFINQSIKTLSIGIAVTILCSFLFTIMLPLREITPEMTSRLHPNLLDLMVAIFSGIAGAYATAKEEVAKSLAGVAIAVALVPPLSVTGIGLGMLNLEVMSGSFLLFATNLIGITLSASFTFVFLGYSPVHRATKAIIYTSLMMIIISIPLVFSFQNLVQKSNYLSQLKSIKHITVNNHDLELSLIGLEEEKGKLMIELNVISTETVPKNDLTKLKKEIEAKINREIDMKINLEMILK